MPDFSTIPVLSLIYDMGLAEAEQLQEVADESDRSGKNPIQTAVDLEVMDADSILGIVADSLSTEFVDLDFQSPSEEAIKAVDPNTAQMFQALPIELFDDTIRVAFADPLDPSKVDEFAFAVGKEVQLVVADPKKIALGLEKFYAEDKGAGYADILSEMGDAYAHNDEDDEGGAAIISLEDADATDVTRLVNAYLIQAVKDRASDIHFEPFEEDFQIRYRIDGALVQLKAPPYQLSAQIASRIKVMADLKVDERRKPQDGRIPLNLGEKQVELRVSTLPTQFGESIVLRVLDRTAQKLDMNALGMPDDVFKGIDLIVNQPNGIFIVTGPTGSGKTTTLYSCLQRVNDPGSKLLTAEEPVEYDLEGIMQVPVKTGTGMTFLAALRAFLRQDPDIIMVGEMRDLDTAQISIQASLTGHLVMTTVHANDSAGTVTRLVDMGVEPFLVSSTLKGVLSQRLVRTICQRCKTTFEPTQSQLESLGVSVADVEGQTFHYGNGCGACNDTGYKGRKGIYELLKVSESISNLINDRAPTLVIRDKAIEEGMRGLRADGIKAIFEGQTTIEEVLKYT